MGCSYGEELPCKLELSNLEDRFAIAMVHSEVTVGHVPKRICHSFCGEEGKFSVKLQVPNALFNSGTINPHY